MGLFELGRFQEARIRAMCFAKHENLSKGALLGTAGNEVAATETTRFASGFFEEDPGEKII